MQITILTLFPEMFQGPFEHSIVKRAINNNNVKINFINIRDFGIGKHKVVDDTPYGGGNGMILKIDVLYKALKHAQKIVNAKNYKIVLLSTHGKTFNSRIAQNYANLKHLILICGHYEGVDERIKSYINEEISIGDFILTGGEIPAMLITDAVVRHIKGVLKENVAITESFSPHLEYPHYTRPEIFKNKKVPNILLSGNHAKIAKWKKEKSIQITKKLRPDLIQKDSS